LSASAQSALTFTGERFAPEVTGAIWYEHWHRYCLVQPLVRGKTVLDAACGEGYGSYLLAQTAQDVFGIDISAEAIGHARARYAAPNLHYLEGSATKLPLPAASVDCIVSFETIEHLAEQAEMLAEFRRVLAPSGVLVISSPNQPVYSGDSKVGNEFHVRELTRHELATLLQPAFPQQQWYGQRVVAHSAFWAEGVNERNGTLLTLADGAVRSASEPAPPMYFVVLCAAEGVALPALPELSLFDDGRQSLYRDYVRALIRERALTWEERDARKIAEERLAELIAAVNGLASEREKSAVLEARVAALEAAQQAVLGELAATRTESNAAAVARDAATGALAAARDATARAEAEVAAAREAAGSLERELGATREALAAARADIAAVRMELTGTRIDLAAVRAELAAARESLAGTQAELGQARDEIARQGDALREVRARLAFRETAVGWLRWPLARLRMQFGGPR
jgi:SAM-dependent methyltransferase